MRHTVTWIYPTVNITKLNKIWIATTDSLASCHAS